MSFLFGPVRGREDRELSEGNQRSRLHMARDINDIRTINTGGQRPDQRRRRHWTLYLVFAGVLVVLGFSSVLRGGDEVDLAANCQDTAIAVASSQVQSGTGLRYRLTGPDDTAYVVALDGEPIRGDAGSTVAYEETPAGPALRLTQCLSPTLLVAAPAGVGDHVLTMLRIEDDGATTEAASVVVTITD